MTLPFGIGFAWTDDRVAFMKNLHDAGHSFSFITAKMRANFGPVSRSAVIGKCHRLGFPMREPIIARPKDATPRKARARSAAGRAPHIRTAPHPIPSPAPISEPPGAFRCDLMGLTNSSCRWPYGEGPFEFCGAPEADLSAGIAYCRWHSKMAYNPKQDAA